MPLRRRTELAAHRAPRPRPPAQWLLPAGPTTMPDTAGNLAGHAPRGNAKGYRFLLDLIHGTTTHQTPMVDRYRRRRPPHRLRNPNAPHRAGARVHPQGAHLRPD